VRVWGGEATRGGEKNRKLEMKNRKNGEGQHAGIAGDEGVVDDVGEGGGVMKWRRVCPN
jgi:hypothetical protein